MAIHFELGYGERLVQSKPDFASARHGNHEVGVDCNIARRRIDRDLQIVENRYRLPSGIRDGALRQGGNGNDGEEGSNGTRHGATSWHSRKRFALVYANRKCAFVLCRCCRATKQ